jgi:hypothetical protein
VALEQLAKYPPHRPRPTDRPLRTPPRLAPRNGAVAREPSADRSQELAAEPSRTADS